VHQVNAGDSRIWPLLKGQTTSSRSVDFSRSTQLTHRRYVDSRDSLQRQSLNIHAESTPKQTSRPPSGDRTSPQQLP